MLDKLLVADPNHEPRFFASADFAERNSPVTFLTSHMADAFMMITGLKPVTVQAVGYKQKLKNLSPIPVDGYDLVDTTVMFSNGAIVHIFTGWALPNPAQCLTMQSGRLLYSDGALDIWNAWYGYHELTADGINDRNVLFRNFEEDGSVSGYGISNPGKILERIIEFQNGAPRPSETDPFEFGLFTTLICECAVESLSTADTVATGAFSGPVVDAFELLVKRVGNDAASRYYAV